MTFLAILSGVGFAAALAGAIAAEWVEYRRQKSSR